ncbi:phosphotriesterase-related protein-like [Saccostrea echinata]|uniref:phosphotriesterase-related protein-like n=1 Tax=Saccostrea echinata TaxID=191078 RepID=UPI002A81C087|nr:phosphotriesterase-related protein-like [Saccostrea echinata]
MTEKVQTVLGPVDPDTLGITLTHEHLSINFLPLQLPINPKFKYLEEAPVALDTLWYIRQYPYSNLQNLSLQTENAAVVEEMDFYKKNGGGTVVENTTFGIQRDIKFYKNIAKETGVNVVAGTGFYVESSRPETLKMTSEEMDEAMKTDLLHGADGGDIKCGIIGEIGCSWPLGKSERISIQAAANVQSELGCPVNIHPGRDSKAPFEIIRVYQEAGGDVNKLVMSHLDRTIFDKSELAEFAALGSYCEYDMFGIETSIYSCNLNVDMPSDAQRIQNIQFLIDQGFEDKIVIAHDVHTKHRLMKYGGHGYSHILLNVVPQMLNRGISQANMDKILKENPKKWLTMKM